MLGGDAAGTPCAVSPANMVCGSLLASPVTISEKKMPMDSTEAEFMKVAIMPPAAPRASAGTEFIISARFGEANRPVPKPLIATMSPNSQYEKFTGRKARKRKVTAASKHPPTVNILAPNRSDKIPDSGADSRKPRVRGAREMPAHRGCWL